MSENPYAPPSADLGTEAASTGGTGDFDVGRCLSEAWAITWANFPLWLVAGIVIVVVSLLATLSVIGIVLALPVIGWGITLFGLRMHDGGARVGDLFEGFSRYGSALVTMLVVGSVITAIGLAGQSLQLVGEFRDDELLKGLGIALYWVVFLLVLSRLFFSYFYVVDRDVSGSDALREAWAVTAPIKWKVVLLALLSSVIPLVGLLFLIVGVFPAMVITSLLWVSAYRQMAGGPA